MTRTVTTARVRPRPPRPWLTARRAGVPVRVRVDTAATVCFAVVWALPEAVGQKKSAWFANRAWALDQAHHRKAERERQLKSLIEARRAHAERHAATLAARLAARLAVRERWLPLSPWRARGADGRGRRNILPIPSPRRPAARAPGARASKATAATGRKEGGHMDHPL